MSLDGVSVEAGEPRQVSEDGHATSTFKAFPAPCPCPEDQARRLKLKVSFGSASPKIPLRDSRAASMQSWCVTLLQAGLALNEGQRRRQSP